MDRFSGHLSPTEGLEPLGRRLLYGAVLTFVLTLMLVGSAGLLGVAAPAATPAPAAPAPAAPFVPAVQPTITHGDLIVSSGEFFTIQPTLGGNTYSQGGNITVLAGGTLIVRNVILSFVQFVADVGTAQSRLSHVVHFLDQGTVNVYNSTITTDATILNAYVKLNVSVSGTMSLWNSTLAFPGWVSVSGVGAALTLNSSLVTGNPAVRSLSEAPAILGDTQYAPSIQATAGAELNLFNSTLNQTYADNTAFYGMPGPAPLNVSQVSIPANITDLSTATDSANLTLDWLYPSGIGGGHVGVFYNTTGIGTLSTYSVTVWYTGTGHPLGTITIVNDTTDGFAMLNFTAGLTSAINAKGMLNYLNYTGSFGSASRIAVQFGLDSGIATLATQVSLKLLPPLDYNIGVSERRHRAQLGRHGHGPQLDLAAGLGLLRLRALPLGLEQAPRAERGDGLHREPERPHRDPGRLQHFRGAPRQLQHGLPLPLGGPQPDRPRRHDPNLRGDRLRLLRLPQHPVQQRDRERLEQPGRDGPSNLGLCALPGCAGRLPRLRDEWRSGVASILLASSMLTGTSLPDGVFVGAYHFGVILPIPTNNSRWFNWSVSPFPTGVAFGTAGYSGPDWGPNQHFPQYYAGAAITTETISTNGTGVGPRIGQDLTFTTTVTSIGTAPITSAIVDLVYGRNVTLEQETMVVPLTQEGSNYTFALSWTINETVIGDHSEAVNSSFTVFFLWNPGNVSGLSGITNSSKDFLVHPSEISLTVSTYPPTTLNLNDLYITPGSSTTTRASPTRPPSS